MSLAAGSVLTSEEREQWGRLWLFILFAAVCFYVVRFFANLPLLGIWALLSHAGFADKNGNISGKAAWIFYLFGPLTSLLVVAAAGWTIGKDRWKYAREFLSAPPGKFLTLAVIFSTVIGQFVPNTCTPESIGPFMNSDDSLSHRGIAISPSHQLPFSPSTYPMHFLKKLCGAAIFSPDSWRDLDYTGESSCFPLPGAQHTFRRISVLLRPMVGSLR